MGARRIFATGLLKQIGEVHGPPLPFLSPLPFPSLTSFPLSAVLFVLPVHAARASRGEWN